MAIDTTVTETVTTTAKWTYGTEVAGLRETLFEEMVTQVAALRAATGETPPKLTEAQQRADILVGLGTAYAAISQEGG